MGSVIGKKSALGFLRGIEISKELPKGRDNCIKWELRDFGVSWDTLSCLDMESG